MQISKTLLWGISLIAVNAAHASLIFDSGFIAFSQTGTQFGRLTRDGNASIWGVTKAFPGVTGAPTARAYEAFVIHNFDRSFLQISLDDPDVAFFVAAYANTYTPVNLAPNFGLNVNYLGDPGLSQPFGNPSAFQIVVAPNSTTVIVINEITPGTGSAHSFELFVEGFYDANFSETPEPSSILLTMGGGLLLVVLGRRRLRTQ